jgi:hypothetical protein
MGIGMVFAGFAGMVCSMQPVPVSDMRVVRGFFVVALFVVFGSFPVVGRRMLMMFSSFSVMFRSFVVFHRISSFLENYAEPGGNAGSAR